MRLLFCSYDYPPRVGGQARLSQHLVRELRREAEVTVVVSRWYEPAEPDAIALLDFGRSAARNALAMARRAGRRFDLIIAADSDVSGRIANHYSLLTGVPMVHLCHGLDLQRMRRRTIGGAIDRWLFRRSLGAVANSEYTRRAAERTFAPKRIRVVHPGVDLSGPAPRARDDDALQPDRSPEPALLLTVARLVRRKGHHFVLHALAELEEPFEWAILGDGPEREGLERLARDLGLEDRVRFLGALDDRAKREWYARCDFFVLTPYVIDSTLGGDFEGFGIVYLEANAHGKPVVGTRSGGVPEAVGDGSSGLLVPPESPEAIREAVGTLIRDRERQLKGPRARFANPSALKMWGGASGDAQLDYRWSSASNRLWGRAVTPSFSASSWDSSFRLRSASAWSS